jgi:hypothetical protein
MLVLLSASGIHMWQHVMVICLFNNFSGRMLRVSSRLLPCIRSQEASAHSLSTSYSSPQPTAHLHAFCGHLPAGTCPPCFHLQTVGYVVILCEGLHFARVVPLAVVNDGTQTRSGPRSFPGGAAGLIKLINMDADEALTLLANAK